MDLLAVAEAKQPWFYGFAFIFAATLLFLNLLLVVAIHGRRVREFFRGRRARAFRHRFEEGLRRLDRMDERDPERLRREIARFDELERPLAALMLIEHLRPATAEERERTLAALREVGGIERGIRSTRSWIPWRRALALRTLGWTGAEEAVPVALERLSDRNRHVRESAVRALGRIGDARAIPELGRLFRDPGPVGEGVVYDALVAFGPQAESVFAGGLRSQRASVRIASCFGLATVAEPTTTRGLVAPLLDDESPEVRAASAEVLAETGAGAVPEGLARATRDEQPAVRSAATAALGSFDDPRAVELALGALLDPDRDTAIRAAESLVRLARSPGSATAAAAALERSRDEWPVERATILASLGAV